MDRHTRIRTYHYTMISAASQHISSNCSMQQFSPIPVLETAIVPQSILRLTGRPRALVPAARHTRARVMPRVPLAFSAEMKVEGPSPADAAAGTLLLLLSLAVLLCVSELLLYTFRALTLRAPAPDDGTPGKKNYARSSFQAHRAKSSAEFPKAGF